MASYPSELVADTRIRMRYTGEQGDASLHHRVRERRGGTISDEGEDAIVKIY